MISLICLKQPFSAKPSYSYIPPTGPLKNLLRYVCPSLFMIGLVASSSPAYAAKIFAGTQTIEPATATSQILLNIPSGTGGSLATTAVRVGLGDIGLRSSASVNCGSSGCGTGVFGLFAGVYGSEDLLTLSVQSGFIRFDFDLTGTMGGLGSSPSSGQVTLQSSLMVEILNLNNNQGVRASIGQGFVPNNVLFSPGVFFGATAGAIQNLVSTTSPTVGISGGFTPGTFRLTGQISIPYTNGQALLRLALTPNFLCGIRPPPPGPFSPPATCSFNFDSFNSTQIGGAQVLDSNGLAVAGASLTSASGFDYTVSIGAAPQVPEPATWSLAIAGLAALAFARRRK